MLKIFQKFTCVGWYNKKFSGLQYKQEEFSDARCERDSKLINQPAHLLWRSSAERCGSNQWIAQGSINAYSTSFGAQVGGEKLLTTSSEVWRRWTDLVVRGLRLNSLMPLRGGSARGLINCIIHHFDALGDILVKESERERHRIPQSERSIGCNVRCTPRQKVAASLSRT